MRVTQSELARLLDIPRPNVHKYVSRGVLELDEDGLIDVDQATAALAADPAFGSKPLRDDRQPSPLLQQIFDADTADEDTDADAGHNESAAGMPTSYQKARAMREQYAAMREKTKHEIEQGRLIESHTVQRGITDLLSALVNSLERTPDNASAELPDPFRHATRLRIREELDRALADARNHLARLLPETAP